MNLLYLFSSGPIAEIYKHECLCKDNFEVTWLNTDWWYTLNRKVKMSEVLDQSSKQGTETKPGLVENNQHREAIKTKKGGINGNLGLKAVKFMYKVELTEKTILKSINNNPCHKINSASG